MAIGKGSTINGYHILEEFKNVGGGNGQYTFAEKNGKEYFLKKFLKPTYPIPESPGSMSTKQKKKEACRVFEERHREIQKLLLPKSLEGDNLLVANDFFRHGAYYYKVTDKINPVEIPIKKISSLDFEEILLLIKTLTHSVKILHSVRIVHGDLKPDNILIKRTEKNRLVAKLIDFDDSFFSKNPPVNRSEIIGDPMYYSPELGEYINNNEAVTPSDLTLSSDVFALGIIFHQYITGKLPGFNQDKYPYPYIAASVEKGGLIVSDNMPVWIKNLIQEMLCPKYSNRPDINSIFQRLRQGDNGFRGDQKSNLKGDLVKKFSSTRNSSMLKGKGLSIPK